MVGDGESGRLPLVAPHQQEHTYCAYCPKLCRFACPVSTVQGRETTTPWGKMTSLHHVAVGNLEMDRSHAATWWACTGCMRCRTFCNHGNEVAATLNAGRAEARRAGTAPAAAYDVVERHEQREEQAARAARARFSDAMDRSADTVYVPGCTACATAPDIAGDGLGATEGLLEGSVRMEAEGCCGLPLLDSGDREGFVRAARRFLGRLEGARRVVFGDPGCLYALRIIAPRLGLHSPVDAMVHLTELAAERLDRLAPLELAGPVRWHDPCRLGRGLGVYDAPRSVLGRLLGRACEEMPQSREGAECSGGGGQVPRTAPETSRGIAADRLSSHRDHGGGLLVTACPGAVRSFRKATDTEDEVTDIANLLARAVRR